MAKKRAKQGEKQAFRNASKDDVKRQRLRRRTGDVKRVELILKADSTRDQYIADKLNALARGTTSEFVRQAIEEKFAREIAPHSQPTLTADEMRAVVADEMRAQLSGFKARAAAMVEISFDEPPVEVQSSGIDMSRDRPRPKSAQTQPAQIAPPEPEELTEAQQIEYAQIMAESIKNAQPGRMD